MVYYKMDRQELIDYIKENLDKVFDIGDDYVINNIYSFVKESITFDQFMNDVKAKWASSSHLIKRQIYDDFRKLQ